MELKVNLTKARLFSLSWMHCEYHNKVFVRAHCQSWFIFQPLYSWITCPNWFQHHYITQMGDFPYICRLCIDQAFAANTGQKSAAAPMPLIKTNSRRKSACPTCRPRKPSWCPGFRNAGSFAPRLLCTPNYDIQGIPISAACRLRL